MGRWEPDARSRLLTAAVELFSEEGYDNTTVAQIAQRAGLTKSTFFRHFPDKREVLSAGQADINAALADGIAGAPSDATPLAVVGDAVAALERVFADERREFSTQVRDIVAAHPELQEREALKRAGFARVLVDGLTARGVDGAQATVAAELGVLAIRTGFARWADPGCTQSFGVVARAALDELRGATLALS